MISYFLQYEILLNVANNLNQTPLSILVSNEKVSYRTIKMLLENKANPNFKKSKLLATAINHKNLSFKVISNLLKYGADSSEKGIQG